MAAPGSVQEAQGRAEGCSDSSPPASCHKSEASPPLSKRGHIITLPSAPSAPPSAWKIAESDSDSGFRKFAVQRTRFFGLQSEGECSLIPISPSAFSCETKGTLRRGFQDTGVSVITADKNYEPE